MIPKNTILRLLSEGLKDKSITVSEVTSLLPKKSTKGARKVAKPIRDRATSLTAEMGIADDGLRFSAMKGDGANTHFLYLFNTETNAVAAKRIGEKFNGIDDMRRAADVVLGRYLETCG
jgi:hypothetical protein